MNSLTKSRKKIDAEIMYEMRRQGKTNLQIAKALEVHPSTVYNYIGRMSEAVKHAEVQNKPPVVDKPKTETRVMSAEADFKPFVPKPKEVEGQAVKKPLLAILSAKYTMQGEMCQYIIDTSAGTVEMAEGNSMVTGILDKQTIRRFIEELEQVDEMLKEGRVSA